MLRKAEHVPQAVQPAADFAIGHFKSNKP
jgi:hypothetical protein